MLVTEDGELYVANKDLRDWLDSIEAAGELHTIKGAISKRISAALSISSSAGWAIPR